MNTQEIIARSNRNKTELLKSTILAKTALRMEDGSIRIITVHELSTRYEFYQVYKTKAKTARAPRNGWKHIQNYGRDINTVIKAYSDFRSFVTWYAKTNHAEVLSVRVLKVRRMAALLLQTVHESITTDWSWSPAMNSSDKRDFRYQHIRLNNSISGREIDPTWTGRR